MAVAAKRQVSRLKAPSAFGGFTQKLRADSMGIICSEAGWRDDREAADVKGYSELAVAIAISFAESGFYADATNRSSAGIAHGLFQIMQPSLNPELLDGQTNANVAYRMYADGGNRFFGPWASSNYKPHLAMAQRVVMRRADDRKLDLSLDNAIDNVKDVGKGVTETFDLVAKFLENFFGVGFWIRAGLAIGGVILVIIAIIYILKGFVLPSVGKLV